LDAVSAGEDRTVGIWGLLALFVVIGVVGLVVLLTVSSPRSPTEQVGDGPSRNTVLPTPTTPTTAPPAPGADDGGGDAADTPATGDATAGTGDGAAGSADGDANATTTTTSLPAGVTGVLRDQGTTVLSLEVPAELGTTPTTPVVAPVRVRPSADGSSITVVVSCARSQAEAPAQVSVTETPDAITVLAVTLVPEGGAPCDPAAAPREVAIALQGPVGGRSLIAVPGGTAIPGAPS
jgi:hypothetical protein